MHSSARILALAPLLTACLADIRPESLAESPVISSESESAGRALIEGGVRAAGGWEAWRGLDGTTMTAEDHWRGIFALASPWPASRQDLEMTLWHGTMDSRVTLRNGPQEDWMWGLNNGELWRAKPNRAAKTTKSAAMSFMLPTLHYFVDFPWRIAEADRVAHIGEQTIDNTVYERVYATWGSVEPTAEVDQYVLFYRQDTGRLERSQFTVREGGRAIVGSILFRDLRDVRGVQLPHDMVITFRPDADDHERYIHRITVQSYGAE